MVVVAQGLFFDMVDQLHLCQGPMGEGEDEEGMAEIVETSIFTLGALPLTIVVVAAVAVATAVVCGRGGGRLKNP
jgi:hypothetical protein